MAVCSENGINGYSARIYQLMDKESMGGIVIPLGITSSWMSNPPEE
jgi:hypothetical protein